MPFTYFIADLHLSDDRPDITACLMTFLQHEAPQAEALYVLGDLFEVWIGDDNITPFNEHIAAAFKQVSLCIPVYFIHGNRDFAIRDTWAKKAGMTLLNEQEVIYLYGHTNTYHSWWRTMYQRRGVPEIQEEKQELVVAKADARTTSVVSSSGSRKWS